jgi:hypothetical protein
MKRLSVFYRGFSDTNRKDRPPSAQLSFRGIGFTAPWFQIHLNVVPESPLPEKHWIPSMNTGLWKSTEMP